MRILLAEDDVHVSIIRQICLEKIGSHSVLICENGEVAIEALRHETFDLVILDGMMPKKNGVQTAKEMTQLGRPEPIIFLSAKSDEKDVAEFLSLACGYIAKPFDPQTICQQIDQILAQNRAKRSA